MALNLELKATWNWALDISPIINNHKYCFEDGNGSWKANGIGAGGRILKTNGKYGWLQINCLH